MSKDKDKRDKLDHVFLFFDCCFIITRYGKDEPRRVIIFHEESKIKRKLMIKMMLMIKKNE